MLKSETIEAIKSANVVAEVASSSTDDIPDLILKIKAEARAAASAGKWEYSVILDKDYNYLMLLAARLKADTEDVMVLLDKGNKKITVSWYLSNEV